MVIVAIFSALVSKDAFDDSEDDIHESFRGLRGRCQVAQASGQITTFNGEILPADQDELLKACQETNLLFFVVFLDTTSLNFKRKRP